MSHHSPAEQRVQVNGLSTLYYEAGEGAPVLVLPGAGADPKTWFRVMTELARTHRVIVLSLPGMGGTSPGQSVRPAMMASFVADFLDVLAVDSVVALGHSYGGLVVAELALQRADAVSRLVLVDAGGLGRAAHPAAIALSLLPARAADALSAAVSLPGVPTVFALASNVLLRQSWRIPGPVWAAQHQLAQSRTALRVSLEVFRECGSLTGQRESVIVTDRLWEITVPALVIWGGTDQLFPAWQGWAAARRLPSGRFVLLTGAGHLSYLDSHQEFMDALGPFVRDDLTNARSDDSELTEERA
ncbi:alpha/beta fold hydrolase [Streptomyces sp. NPDC097107]|uniref:alpha/beta fold hydrolase n=1 Tax=Streptomyces sp. NPDC097107 TaxID=3366089 RepID=UPI0037FCD723